MSDVRPGVAALALAALLVACAGDGRRHQSQLEALARTAEPRPEATELPSLEGATLAREAFVRAVLARSPSLGAAREAWRAAVARYPQETSLPDPMLGVGIGPRSFGDASVRDAWRADLAQSLPFPGKLGLRGAMALAEGDAAAGDFEAVRQSLAAMASLLYDDYCLSHRTLAVEEHHVALLRELEASAIARLASGQALLQDPVQAAAELAHRRHDRVRAETGRRVVKQQMNLLLHRAPDAPLAPPPAEFVPAPLPADLDSDREALVQDALEARPELRVARARLGSAESAVALAEREYLPDFTVRAGYDAFWQERPLQPSVGLELNLPIRRERRLAAVDEAEARRARAVHQTRAAEAEIRSSVHQALERVTEARHVLHLQERELVPAARTFVEVARAGFETGGGTFQTLVEAERGFRTAELEREAALVELSRRAAELARALGRTAGIP